MDSLLVKIHTWGAQSWWQALIVNAAGAALGILLLVFGAKYLPASVNADLTADIAATHVDTISPTVVSLP